MRDIDVIPFVSCSGTLIYIINFQFQPNLRWSNFRPQYWDFETSNGRLGPKFYARVLQMVSFFSFHHSSKQQPPAVLISSLFLKRAHSNLQVHRIVSWHIFADILKQNIQGNFLFHEFSRFQAIFHFTDFKQQKQVKDARQYIFDFISAKKLN